MKAKYDWNSVDWTQPDLAISQQLGATVATVNQRRPKNRLGKSLKAIFEGELSADDPQWRAGLILLASLEVPPQPETLSRHLGLPLSEIEPLVARLRESGVITADHKLAIGWLEDDPTDNPGLAQIAFIMDCLTASGEMVRMPPGGIKQNAGPTTV